MNNLQIQIEALLFTLGVLSRKELMQKLGVSSDALEDALGVLASAREGRGIVLVDDGIVLELRASPAASELIEKVRKEEYAQGIGRAGLEALAAILYRGPLTRSEIDFIRGVNSTQTLRTLAMRGLVRKVPNPKDERSFLYEATTEALSHLGIARLRELPEYDTIREKLQELEAAYRAKEHDA
jgi:segregation and condensation protein B